MDEMFGMTCKRYGYILFQCLEDEQNRSTHSLDIAARFFTEPKIRTSTHEDIEITREDLLAEAENRLTKIQETACRLLRFYKVSGAVESENEELSLHILSEIWAAYIAIFELMKSSRPSELGIDVQGFKALIRKLSRQDMVCLSAKKDLDQKLQYLDRLTKLGLEDLS